MASQKKQNSVQNKKPSNGHATEGKRMTYQELWEVCMKCGLISKNRVSEPRYYHMVFRKNLEARLAAYKAASVTEKKKLAADLERVLKEECAKADAAGDTDDGEEKSSAPSGNHASNHGNRYHSAKEAPEEEFSQISKVLVRLWQEGTTKGLIWQENGFHRAIPSFITPSELQVLLCEYTDSSVEHKKAMACCFKQRLDAFNASIPAISRFFKVYRTYAEVWEKASEAGIIPADTEYNVDYAEWLPAKDLVAHTQSLSVILPKDDRKAMRGIILRTVAAKLSFAKEVLAKRQELEKLSLRKILLICEEEKLLASDNDSYQDCESCLALLNREDVIAALTSWMFNDEASAMARYLQWHEYRKSLHEAECSDEQEEE
jgi:hypothetical protein